MEQRVNKIKSKPHVSNYIKDQTTKEDKVTKLVRSMAHDPSLIKQFKILYRNDDLRQLGGNQIIKEALEINKNQLKHQRNQTLLTIEYC